ncbi:hypothetical protein MPRF_32630 [Mycolicibacterium parafortuitum]|uniref:Uncharacterized protein n=2 Tax=Mycolicibacterium parafortuitum TaxID=39692 RepID=A0A7I7U4R0_MYCPF|nr:hypothetical protein MPRF_32630 [Mycolicibacterium parafortuitum]
MMDLMPRSKGRKKTAKGKAWRAGRDGASDSDAGAGDPRLDGIDVEALEESLSAVDATEHARYRDEELGARLVSRGWVAVHAHVQQLSDMWVWPPSTPGDDGWVPTMITVQPDGYIMQSADYAEHQVDHALHYDTRVEVLADLESIEAYRHPRDPRTS